MGFVKRFTTSVTVACLSVLMSGLVAGALAVPPAPSLQTPIVDQTGTLTAEQITTLAQQIAASRTQKDYQLAILIIASLQDDSLESYSIKVAREWGIGTAQQDNGVLLLVVKNDRQLRIEVGRGLEGDLTDVETGRIIRNTITPQFKKGDYFSGISLGVQNIAAQVEGHPEQDTSQRGEAQGLQGVDFEAIAFVVLFVVLPVISWFFAIMARTKSWWLGGVVGGVLGSIALVISAWAVWAFGLTVALVLIGLLFDWAVSKNYVQHAQQGTSPSWWAGGPWIGGGWHGGSGGGGGGGFGGGGFSGGGSSGSW